MQNKDKPQRRKFRQETVIHSYIVRPLAFEIVRLVYNTTITANHLTIFRIILNIGSLFFVASGSLTGFTVGFILFQLHEIIDHADGMLARMKMMTSKLGTFLESFFDSIFSSAQFAMGAAYAYAGYHLTGRISYLCLFVASSIGYGLTLQYKDVFFPDTKKIPLQNRDHDKEKLLSIIGVPFRISIKNSFITIFTWQNQLLLWAGLFYFPIRKLFGFDILLVAFAILAGLNQVPWMKLGYDAFKKARYLDRIGKS